MSSEEDEELVFARIARRNSRRVKAAGILEEKTAPEKLNEIVDEYFRKLT